MFLFKKGQITIFVILGILLVVGVLLFLSLQSFDGGDVIEDVDGSVFYSVNICADSSLRIALEEFDLITDESYFLNEAEGNVSFIVHNGEDLFPSDAVIELVLNDLFESAFLSCVGSLKDTFDFSLESFEGEVNVLDNSVSFGGEISLNLLSQELVFLDRAISASLISSFKNDMSLLRSFSFEQSSDPEMFNIGLLSEISFLTGADYHLFFREGTFFVNFLFYDEETDLKRGVWFAVN